jgi:methionyl-tRNA formyltransferase
MKISSNGKVNIICGKQSWSMKAFNNMRLNSSNTWHFISTEQELDLTQIQAIDPRYIFFLHWSWRVPDEIINQYECVCFHMTDVPYGRGGSPLQNLIMRGHQTTKLTALRMTQEFDAGPVYMKEDLSLGGSAEEVYIRATQLSLSMIERIVTVELMPVPQTGDATVFKRRKPSESEILELDSLEKLHDFIRMLDAEGYPKAFIEHNGFRFEFNRSALYSDRIVADVVITPIQKQGNDA